MEYKRNSKLITKILIVGAVIAVLSYFFHPEVGQLSVTVDGNPISDSFVRFAAIPTFLLILGLAAFLTILLFLGIGFFMFIGAMFFAWLFAFLLRLTFGRSWLSFFLSLR